MINIFQKKYLDLFTEYGYGINCISDIISGLGYHSLVARSSKEAKEAALDVIEQLFNNDIIYVLHWGLSQEALKNKITVIKDGIPHIMYEDENQEKLKNKNISIQEAMTVIKLQWFEGAKYEDFFGMTTFFYKDWYMEKLKELNIGVNTDWDWFSNDIVPKIKNWSKERNCNQKEINVNES